MKESFVFPLWNRHHSAHTNFNGNILRLFYQDGKTPGGLGCKASGEITKSNQFHLAVSSSSILDFRGKNTILKLLESGYVEGEKSKLPEPVEVTENGHGYACNLTILAPASYQWGLSFHILSGKSFLETVYGFDILWHKLSLMIS